MKSGVPAGFDRLRDAFARGRGAAGLHRNAGVLVAELCRGVPKPPEAVTFEAVAAALRLRQRHGEHHRPGLAAEPPLPRPEFERTVAARLALIDDAALDHWFAFGCPPPDAKPLAKAAESLPARVARLVNRARRRPRLVGAAALAPVIDAALTIPPRRRVPDPLPQGGYADVTTRGQPERLLPGQFALDPDEFVRRFAENELLYFEREEPHAAARPGKLVVLDQGVRTWGGVRLALAAAALALAGKNANRAGRVALAATSSPDVFDLAAADPDELADVLEASDRTATPAACLARALADPADPDDPRDVVLLTHPRAVREPDVVAAARRRRKTDRLFALSVDEAGRAEFAEWTAGGVVPARTFRIDLELGEAARVAGEPPKTPVAAWAGDVEPVPFPFRPGLVTEPTHLGFDAAGDWLVVAGRDGALHGVPLDGRTAEVLPRAFRGGVLLKSVDAVLGVSGGVVVCGHAAVGERTKLFAAHYDRVAREVTLHEFDPLSKGAQWESHPDLHCVVARRTQMGDQNPGCAVDLATGGRYPGGTRSALVARAQIAWSRPARTAPRPLPLAVRGPTISNGWYGVDPCVFVAGATIEVRNIDPPWPPFEPTREGRPLLAGATVEEAQLAGGVLAVVLLRGGERVLALFRGPGGDGLGEVAHHRDEPFALSRDGGLLARRRWHREVVVSDAAAVGSPRVVVAQAGLHNGLGVRLDAAPFRLTVRVGGFEHTFTVSDNRLSHALARGGGRADRPDRVPAGPLPCDYDPARFPRQGRAAAGNLRAAPDRLGQVVLYAASGATVAAFAVRRERAAAWAPGNVFWGDAALIGGPPTPAADRTIGTAILTAGG
jgi:hypothetical protein